jgi:hypothetical protein
LEGLNTRQIAELCGSSNYTSPFVRVLGLAPMIMRGPSHGGHLYRFSDVERSLLALLPEGFPIFDDRTELKFSEALCAVRMNELIPSRSTHPCVVQRINIVHVNAFLGAGPEGRRSSLFDRYGFREPDGSQIMVTSHAFRHWLNTIAQKGGLSQIDIARWSGRKSVAQNSAYNHMTAAELLETVKGLTGRVDEIKVFGPMGDVAPCEPVARAEFIRMQIPAAHTTDLGFCTHDFAMTPCPIHGDCGNCSEHLFIKGDPRQMANLDARLEDAEAALAMSRKAEADGSVGANRWTAHHLRTVARLRLMKSKHMDPSIPDRSIVQLPTPDMPSEIRISVEERAKDDDDLESLLANIRLG